jgi:hypothetical protein
MTQHGLPLEERFWRFVDVRPDHWLWTGSQTSKGYGKFSYRENGKVITVSAHIFAWRLLVGPIPPEFTPENTYVPKEGQRVCRQCGRDRNRKHYWAHR